MLQLKPIAGGAAEGRSWCEGLAADAKWPEVVKCAKQSLMTMDCDEMENKIDSLDQAGSLQQKSKQQHDSEPC